MPNIFDNDLAEIKKRFEKIFIETISINEYLENIKLQNASSLLLLIEDKRELYFHKYLSIIEDYEITVQEITDQSHLEYFQEALLEIKSIIEKITEKITIIFDIDTYRRATPITTKTKKEIPELPYNMNKDEDLSTYNINPKDFYPLDNFLNQVNESNSVIALNFNRISEYFHLKGFESRSQFQLDLNPPELVNIYIANVQQLYKLDISSNNLLYDQLLDLYYGIDKPYFHLLNESYINIHHYDRLHTDLQKLRIYKFYETIHWGNKYKDHTISKISNLAPEYIIFCLMHLIHFTIEDFFFTLPAVQDHPYFIISLEINLIKKLFLEFLEKEQREQERDEYQNWSDYDTFIHAFDGDYDAWTRYNL